MSACTFVISRCPQENAGDDARPTDGLSRRLDSRQCREFEDGVASALAAAGARVLVVPHVYYLAPSHPAVARMAQLSGDIALGSWLHPRAAHWTLRAHGIEGDWDGSPKDEPDAESTRAIHCCDLGAFASPEACVEEFRRMAEAAEHGRAAATGPPGVEEVSEPAAPRWYPVLDYSLCAGCKQCFDFCLFGVYTVEGKRVVATTPDNCKPGCPACARVCPRGAIMFPHHVGDPGIAGAPGAKIAGERIDVDAFFQAAQAAGGLPESYLKSVCTSAQCSCQCSCSKPERDDLEDLVDALEELDD